MLGQLGRPLFAWSGGNAGVVAAVHGSSLIDVGFDAVHAGATRRDRSRRAPHNLFADVDALVRAAAPADAQPPPLFTYRDRRREAVAGSPARSRGVRHRLRRRSRRSTVTYEYDRANDGWRRGQNGTTHQRRGRRA